MVTDVCPCALMSVKTIYVSKKKVFVCLVTVGFMEKNVRILVQNTVLMTFAIQLLAFVCRVTKDFMVIVVCSPVQKNAETTPASSPTEDVCHVILAFMAENAHLLVLRTARINHVISKKAIVTLVPLVSTELNV